MTKSKNLNRNAIITRNIFKVLQYILAIIITIAMVFPIYWMVVTSLKTSEEMLETIPSLWPKNVAWSNYSDVLKMAPFGLYIKNTVIMTVGIMALQLSTGILAAYGFARGNFKGKKVLFFVVLGALMIPLQVTFVPIYVMIADLHWLNTFQGLIIPTAVSAYFIFMMRQTFMSVDQSYIDAAKVDGMGRFGIIFRVLIPMSKSTMVTVTVLNFIDGWNSYFWPRMITNKPEMRTISQGVYELRRSYAGLETLNYNQVMAGAVIAIIPIVIMFVLMQRHILDGVSRAGMK